MRYRTRFLGREKELATIRATGESGAGLLTLLGPPGIGKTRLAFEAAKLFKKTHKVAICELESALGRESICDALMHTLKIPARYSGGHGNEIGPWLARRGKLVIVLDNLEQIVDPISALLKEWMKRAQDVFFLTTSRQQLALGEELHIHPLADAALTVGTELFVHRAPELQRSELRAGTAASLIRDLVTRLGGNPLAIELAAARLEVLTLEQLETSIIEHLPQLRDPTRQGRHASVADAIGWSWNMLPDWGQGALRQLSVFRGGFTLEGAQAVVMLPSVDAELALESAPATVLDAIHALVRHSLLWRTDHNDRTRFRVPVPVREFASLKQTGERRAEVEDRHRDYCLMLPASTKSRDRTIRDAEHDNLMAAFWRSEAHPPSLERSTNLLGLVVLLSHRMHRTGVRDEHLRLLHLAIEDAHADCPPELLARALSNRRQLFRYTNNLEAARDDALRALRLTESSSDLVLRAMLKSNLAETYAIEYRIGESKRLVAEALSTLQAAGDVRGEGSCLQQAAHLALLNGELGEAERLGTRALKLIRQTGDRQFEGHVLNLLGATTMETGRISEAAAHWNQAIDIFEALNDPRHVGLTRGYLGLTAHHLGDLSKARQDYLKAVQVGRDFSDLRLVGWFVVYLGLLDLEMGQFGPAEAQLKRALVHFEEAPDIRSQGIATSALSALAFSRNRLESNRLFDNAKVLLTASKDPHIRPILRVYRAWAELRMNVQVLDELLPDHEQLRTTVSDDVRLALRAIDSELERQTNAQIAVRIQRTGLYFERPGRDRVSLGRRRNLSKILALLARRRVREPGVPVTLDELIAAGWPETQVSQKSIANRAYVALSTLRKLGLDDVLLRGGDGYLLSTDLPVHLVE